MLALGRTNKSSRPMRCILPYKALEKKRYSLYLKRLFDFSMSSVMLVLLSPVSTGTSG